MSTLTLSPRLVEDYLREQAITPQSVSATTTISWERICEDTATEMCNITLGAIDSLARTMVEKNHPSLTIGRAFRFIPEIDKAIFEQINGPRYSNLLKQTWYAEVREAAGDGYIRGVGWHAKDERNGTLTIYTNPKR